MNCAHTIAIGIRLVVCRCIKSQRRCAEQAHLIVMCEILVRGFDSTGMPPVSNI